MSRIPTSAFIFFGLLIAAGAAMAVAPGMFCRWSARYFEQSNRWTRRLCGLETRMVDEAIYMKFIRFWGIFMCASALFILWLSASRSYCGGQ
ncbi:MAG: hypothetical protein ABIG11_01150 [bacterium]